MPPVSAALLVLLAGVALGGCAARGVASGPSQNPNVLTSWELTEVQDMNVMEAIRRLRPQWLRVRFQPSRAAEAGTATRYPKIHMNGVPLQGISELESMQVPDVRELRFLEGPDASLRFGTGYTNGVILILTER